MIKIAILSLDPRNGGGVLHSLQALYNFLEKQGHQPTVFFLNFDPKFSASLRHWSFNSKDTKMELFGMRCFGIGARWAFWEPTHYTATLESWEKALQNYDLFFVSSGTAIAGHPLALLKKKYILWIATPFWDDRKDRVESEPFFSRMLQKITKSRMMKIEKDVLLSASAILPMSNYAQDCFKSILGKQSITEMTTCPFPIKVQPATPNYTRKIVVAVGRFTDPRKNAKLLFQAWEKIEQETPGAILMIVGSLGQPDKEKVKRSHSIYLAENPSDAEKMEIISKSSLMIISSWQEGLGIVGLEALSCGIPVLSTDCGGIRDFVLLGQTGEIVQLNNPAELANATINLLNNPEKLKALGSTGQKLISTRFCPNLVETTWKKSIESIEKNNSPTP